MDHVIDRACHRHALDNFGPILHDGFKGFEIFPARQRQFDARHDFEIEAKREIIQQRDAAGDEACFLHALDSAPAGRGRKSYAISYFCN